MCRSTASSSFSMRCRMVVTLPARRLGPTASFSSGGCATYTQSKELLSKISFAWHEFCTSQGNLQNQDVDFWTCRVFPLRVSFFQPGARAPPHPSALAAEPPAPRADSYCHTVKLCLAHMSCLSNLLDQDVVLESCHVLLHRLSCVTLPASRSGPTASFSWWLSHQQAEPSYFHLVFFFFLLPSVFLPEPSYCQPSLFSLDLSSVLLLVSRLGISAEPHACKQLLSRC